MTFFDYPTGDTVAPENDAQYFLPGATDDDWADLLRLTTRRHLNSGETLISAGSQERSLYLLIEGQLEVLLPRPRGRWRRVATVGAGNVIGELAFFDGDTRSAMVRTMTPVVAAELTHESFATLSAARPDLAIQVAMDLGRILAQRLRLAQASPQMAG